MSAPVIPTPPNPDDYVYQNPAVDGVRLYHKAVYQWMQGLKGTLEIILKQSIRPAGQPIVLGSFTTNTTVSSPSTGTGVMTGVVVIGTSTATVTSTGTVTSTDLANAVCSIVQAMTMRGFLTPKVGQ